MDHDDRTRIIPEKSQPSGPPPIPGFSEDRTRMISRPVSPYGEETRRTFTGTAATNTPVNSDKTVILGPTTRRSSSAAPLQSALDNFPKDNMNDPVVGWLAIVSGPGAGGFVRLGYGMNSIGRAADQRCQLDFGDEKISRQSHASISYDPRGRKFYLLHGGGQNLTYIAETPVLQPMELIGGEFITLGNTTLRFVRLCGPEFDYQDIQQANS